MKKLKSINLRRFLADDKILASVQITVYSIFLFSYSALAITDLIFHKNPANAILGAFAWVWIVAYSYRSHKHRQLKKEHDKLMFDTNQLIKLLMMIKDANGRNVLVQDLERKGIIKMEIVTMNEETGEEMPITQTVSPSKSFHDLVHEKETKKKESKLPN